jgi:hypothetical protein
MNHSIDGTNTLFRPVADKSKPKAHLISYQYYKLLIMNLS